MKPVERAIMSMMRGGPNCEPVRLGNLHLYHFWNHEPDTSPGVVNVPWVKDLRSKQLAMQRDFREAQRYLEIDRRKFATSSAFIAPTEMFAREVQRWYGHEAHWVQFANYPDRIEVPDGPRRDEVVYVDFTTSAFDPTFYERLLEFASEFPCPFVIVAGVMHDRIAGLTIPENVQLMGTRGEYDCMSRWGVLVNVDSFAQAAECLPRKLLLYLHCGMVPLIHGTFAESIAYCWREVLEPMVYYTNEQAVAYVNHSYLWHLTPAFDRDRFCIESRIGDLLSELQGFEATL